MPSDAYRIAIQSAKRKKFNKVADQAVTKGVEAIFDTNGKRIVMKDLHQRRIKAQMDSK